MDIDLKQLSDKFDPSDIEWCAINGGRYEVSNTGKLRVIATGRYVPLQIKKNGYIAAVITINKIRQNVLIHRLVALAFLGITEKKMQVNHIDGIKTNNHVSNLEWVTQAENNRHAHRMGLNRISDANKKARIKAVKQKLSRPVKCTTTGLIYPSQAECAQTLNLSQANISAVISGRRPHTGGLHFEHAK